MPMPMVILDEIVNEEKHADFRKFDTSNIRMIKFIVQLLKFSSIEQNKCFVRALNSLEL